MLTKIKFPDFIFNSPVYTEDVTLIVMNLNVMHKSLHRYIQFAAYVSHFRVSKL